MPVLSHEHLDISHDRKTVFLVNQRVCGSLKNDVRNQSRLLVSSRVLPDWYSHCEMVVWQIRADSLVSKNHIEPYDGVLRIFSALEEHIDINVLDQF